MTDPRFIELKSYVDTQKGSEGIALQVLQEAQRIFGYLPLEVHKFIAKHTSRHIGDGINLRTQDTRYSLFDSPTRAFALRPDLVLEFDGKTIVMDTKWKLLSDNARNSGISQSDMYQMYAYSKKYGSDYPALSAFR